ncbi:GWxTD domain-containing protein [Xanthocytophaga agilis]|uniref:GWxTD domain-containing protein n=1 Tax=Xanthocytophaga agilis TaxID=3048010 RepID=A0AAE3UGE2_9BACT|nr:GWxTD domain-containing protein [Xanthocytophaga agilis]MDJ1502382.1 GWxTD domain-containing protein [Xanthocytophaga agilis]
MKLYYFFLGAALLVAGCSRPPASKPVSNPNKPIVTEEISLIPKTKTLVQDTAIRVFVEAQILGNYQSMTPQRFVSDFIFNYAILPDYSSRDILQRKNVRLTVDDLTKLEDNRFLFSFTVPKLQVPTALLLLEINNLTASKKVLHDVPLKFTSTRLSDTYGIFDQYGEYPMIRNFATQTDTLQIADLNHTKRSMVVTHYSHDFEPAPSPMGSAAKNVPKTLEPDTLFTVSTNQSFTLPKPGLYFFQEDTSQNSGVSIWIGDKRYPRYTHPQDLVEPLIYISTKNELKELQTTTIPKKTLDTYWLRLTSNSETRAKRSIRAYYRRVATANRLFSSYKEGWKTDMGMIYIVLGQPDQVTRLKDKEVWTYTQNANFSEINFTFMRRPNAFTEEAYELVRYVEYEPIWYPVVEEWRKGVVE